ncbi:NACHT, LRR and PYD domains-containing protein 3-like isoform X1 [Sardina pilchardus]|uniref:NACHT, LRR and PYD domains-containing protein 3-like isoform X1 n=1 Tax=Sardina pilchardus TaxID=27697 RepID=UPI002E0F1D89
MSGSQEREEDAAHGCVQQSTKQTHSDGGPQTHRPPSPVPSSVSMKSDKSMGGTPDFSSEPVPSGLTPQTHRPPSPVPSSVSMKSDKSMGGTPDFGSEPVPSGLKSIVDQTRHGVCEQVQREPVISRKKELDEGLRRVIGQHKASLKRRVENISEGIVKPGAEILLNTIYTELYITEGENEGVNREHEVLQAESASRSQTTEDTPINCNDIFKPLPGQKCIRTVMTKGVAGIGKTVSVQKFILDWTDGVANQDVDFIFPLSFRKLNLVRGDQYSLHSLLLDFHPELKELNDSEEYKDCQVVFIFDGLDESRLTLDLEQNSKLSDVKQTSSVDVLMTSLIQGTLFPSALIWITSRPAAASQIPVQYIGRVTEIRGFNDPQKEEYFRKKISDESQANRIISHIKICRSLYIMCHIPVFCWIAATVLQQMLEQGNTQAIPTTLTEMFIQFLLIQTTRKNQKYQSGTEANHENPLESQREILLKLAELAFKNLENGNLMFYEEDLRGCGIDVNEASVFSGMCTEIFKEESVFHQRKVYCFVHLSVQEFLAALHVFMSVAETVSDKMSILAFLAEKTQLEDFLEKAVNKALQSKNGHLDLFLRFLMGISLETNQRLLQGLLTHPLNSSESIKKICNYIKELKREDLSPERCLNLFHCLFEMNDHSMQQEINKYLNSPKDLSEQLSSAHCSALANMLLMSEEVLDEFDLKKYNTSDEGRRRLIPAVRCCRKARLAECALTDKSFESVAAVLHSPNFLTELDLSYNDLKDSGVQLLSKALSSPHCKLQALRFADCKLSEKSCALVTTVLQSPNSMIELDLSHNDLGDSGVQLLSKGLSSPHCTLQTLRLAECKLLEKSCGIVATILQSPNSLIELDLSYNDLKDSGVQLLSKGLSSPHCKLETLRLSDCLISEKSCMCLASVLTSKPLKKLDLSYNHFGESEQKLISAQLEDPICKLEIFKTDHVSEIRARPRLRRYVCKLTLDPNTIHRELSLTDGNRKVTCVNEVQPYPDHPERFDWWWHVLCREGLSGRCYWEAEWSGRRADIAVAYKSVERKGGDAAIILGRNAKSWNLNCSSGTYSVWHNNEHTVIPAPSSGSRRVGVYLDWLAGTLSFYSVSANTLTHLHTFPDCKFTEPLYPGFRVWESDTSVSLC